MTHLTDDPLELAITVPLSAADRAQAQAFAEHQLTPEKHEQVYRNTLAVLAVSQYLQLQQFSPDLEGSDSWSIPNQLCEDAADLMITDFGKVECRPLDSLDEPLKIPPEAWHDRIGYIAVHLNADLTEATLLGFFPPFDPNDLAPDADVKTVPLSELQSMDDLMDYFERLELGQPIVEEMLAAPEYAQLVDADPHTRLIIVAQLERIYRCEPPHEWRLQGEAVLSDNTTEAALTHKRGLTDRWKLRDMAKELLERLAAVWGEGGPSNE